MSLYFYFNELKQDLPFKESSFEKLMDAETYVGEDLGEFIAKKLNRDSFEYTSSSYADKQSNSDGYIINKVYEDFINNEENATSENEKLILLLGRPEEENLYGEYEPYISFYTSKETTYIFEKLNEYKDKIPSDALDRYLEILQEAVNRNKGIIIMAF